jgi:hypothetical protein
VHDELKRHLAARVFVVRFDEMVQNFGAFFDDEGNRPTEKVHEVGKQVRVRALYELLDV